MKDERLPVSFEKAENKVDIRTNFMPPAVVASPPPNKHNPIKTIVMCGISTEEECPTQYELKQPFVVINDNDVKKFPQTNLSPLTKELFKLNSAESILISLRDSKIVMQ